MRLIGISGKIGTGKTTLAGHIIRKEGTSWQRISYSEVLKSEASSVFGFPLSYAYDHKDWQWMVREPVWINESVPYDMSPEPVDGYRRFDPPDKESMRIRDILQWWGSDVRRAVFDDYWLVRMIERLDYLETAGMRGVVVDDIRFPNEADLIRNRGGFLVRINPYPEWRDPYGHEHRSETALDDYEHWDLVLSPKYGRLDEFTDMVLNCSKSAHVLHRLCTARMEE